MRAKSPPKPLTAEQRRAEAIASLERGWRLAEESGADVITDEEIDAEIAIVRAQRLARLKKSTRP